AVEDRVGAAGDPGQRATAGVPRLRHERLQDLRLRDLRRPRRPRRDALRPAGRHHHAEPDRGAALAGDRHLGRLRRPGDALGRAARRGLHQLAPERADRHVPPPLADHPGRPVRHGDHALSRGAPRDRQPAPGGARAASPPGTGGRTGGAGVSPLRLLGCSRHRIAAPGVSRKFQTPSISPRHTVVENMALAAGEKGCLTNTFAGTSAAERERIAAVLAQVGLLPQLETPAGALAHGQKQWLEIAMLLVQSPTLLLLDEPVAGMTRAEKERTVEILAGIVEHSAWA